MATDLIQIGRSGVNAARSALEFTAQNIANANNEDYARRSLGLADVTGTGGIAYYSSWTPGGVRVDQVRRANSLFLQDQARRTSADLARSEAALAGIRNVEASIEEAGIYTAIVEFEASLAALRPDPINPSLRATVLENGRILAQSLQIADGGLDQTSQQVRFDTGASVDQVNLLGAELAQLNSSLARARPGTPAHATLLDRRDAHLRDMAEHLDMMVEYQPSGAVNVRLGSSSGPFLVAGTTASSLATQANADGTLAFTLGGTAVTPGSGALAGQVEALAAQREAIEDLDALAALLIGQVNSAQANGAAQDGSSGQPFFSGNAASNISMVLTSGEGLATAATGSPAGSRDVTNLDALRNVLANGGPAFEADRILVELSNSARNREVARDTLATIAGTAQISLSRETSVDLDAEAANLVRYQQAFEASGRVIQVATDIFDTLLGIR